jgi:hypothetical protein
VAALRALCRGVAGLPDVGREIAAAWSVPDVQRD